MRASRVRGTLRLPEIAPHPDPLPASSREQGEGEELFALPQAEAAGDYAAQHFSRAALDGQFGRDQGGVAQRFLEPIVVAVRLRVAGLRREQAHLVREGLLEISAQILDDGR